MRRRRRNGARSTKSTTKSFQPISYSPAPREIAEGLAKLPSLTTKLYAHRNDPEAAPHHRRRRHPRARLGGGQRCGCREGGK